MSKMLCSNAMLFIDDVVLIEEPQENVKYKIEMWRAVLELKGFHLIRNKIEYIKYKFN